MLDENGEYKQESIGWDISQNKRESWCRIVQWSRRPFGGTSSVGGKEPTITFILLAMYIFITFLKKLFAQEAHLFDRDKRAQRRYMNNQLFLQIFQTGGTLLLLLHLLSLLLLLVLLLSIPQSSSSCSSSHPPWGSSSSPPSPSSSRCSGWAGRTAAPKMEVVLSSYQVGKSKLHHLLPLLLHLLHGQLLLMARWLDWCTFLLLSTTCFGALRKRWLDGAGTALSKRHRSISRVKLGMKLSFRK